MQTKAKIQRVQARPSAIRQQQGVVLLEAMIAILIFSFGILSVVGLQAAMIKNTAQAKYRADANFIAQKMLGDMWAHPTNIADYYNYDCSALLPAGSCIAAPSSGGIPGQVTITITWQPPGDVQHNYVTVATVTGGVA